MIFSMGAGQLDLVSLSDRAVPNFSAYYSIQNFPQNTPIIPRDCPIILRKLSGG